MNSFTLNIPTHIFFGEDQLSEFTQATARLGKHAFIVTGGGTVERLGYLDLLSKALKTAGLEVTHFSGIEPNPEAATVNRAAAELRAAGADFVVALGGGSVMDASKAIAMLAQSGEEDIWPFVLGESRAFQLQIALPIAAVPTTAATASEVTSYAVISNRTTNGKSFTGGDYVKPKVAWLNPAFTVGLTPTTTRNGAADIISHVLENYLLGGNDSALADRHAESVIATVMETLPQAVAQPNDLSARGDLLWASTLALSGFELAGRHESAFPLHFMEHALSAFKPELAHGRGLATLFPSYFRWLLDNDRGVDRLAKLGMRLFGLDGSAQVCAEGFIERFESWLADNDLKQSTTDLGFSEAEYQKIADYTVLTYGDGKQIEALGAITAADIVAIFKGTHRQAKAQ